MLKLDPDPDEMNADPQPCPPRSPTTYISYLIRGEVVKELGHLVVEELLPGEPGPGNTIRKVGRPTTGVHLDMKQNKATL